MYKDRHAPLAQPADDPHQTSHLAFAQSARRLVHDQHFGLKRQRLGDLDQLLIANAERSHRRTRIDVAFQLGEQLGVRRSIARSSSHTPWVNSRPRNTFAAADNCSTRFSSW